MDFGMKIDKSVKSGTMSEHVDTPKKIHSRGKNTNREVHQSEGD
jgi:hypothetical protein